MPVTYNRTTQKWVADYTDQFGNRHRHGHATKKEAKAELVQRESQIMKRTFRPAGLKVKLHEVADDYVANCRRRVVHGELDAVTVKGYVNNVERYVLGRLDLWSFAYPQRKGEFFSYPLGHIAVADVTSEHIREFRARLLDLGLATATVRGVVRQASLILTLAVEKYGLAGNPAASVTRGKKSRAERKKKVVPPEKATVAKLIAAAAEAGDGSDLILAFAALTGLRSSEQRALRWRHVNLAKGEVEVVIRVNSIGELGVPKSEAGARVVPISGRLLEQLREWKGRTRFSGQADLVFPTGKGEHAYHTAWRKARFLPAWDRVLEAADPSDPPEPFSWHYLRHFAVSCWIEQLVPVNQVQVWAGHSAPSVTLDIYGHLFKATNHAHAMDAVTAAIWES